MAINGALPQTLRSITATKIGELSKQRSLFDQRKTEIATAAASAPNVHAKAQILLEGVTKLKGHSNDAFDKGELDDPEEEPYLSSAIPDGTDRAAHANIKRFLHQSQYDPSISESALKDWISHLENEIQHLQLKHDHASFYSGLVTEWLANLDGETASEVSDAAVKVGRAEMHEQRARWEDYVFNPGNVSVDNMKSYLDGLFSATALSQKALEDLRRKVKSFGDGFFAQKTFTVNELQWVTKALLKSDLLSKEKAAILKELMRNPAVTEEVVDVLNMRLASLDSWDWPTSEGLPVEMRRQLNGKYRVFTDEDLLDSLMFQYLGLEWAVTFRNAFDKFLSSMAWEPLREHVPKKDKERRRYYNFDGSRSTDSGVNKHREETYKNDYFMNQLPKEVDGDLPDYDGDGDDSGNADDKRMNALDTKHSLLHLLVTESIINTTLRDQFTAIRSDFKYFGPALPHETILTVLSYFGVPDNWIRFFKTFLQMPLKFIQDGPNATTRVRRRGVPMSHTLSDCFGEVVLFCMDYAVNQSTRGAFLYRLHDDFWFWGQEKSCVQAWAAMSRFASTMGLEFNEEKTGVVRMGNNKSAGEKGDIALPNGDIRWGFLKLDAQRGRFVIEQGEVDNHITELQRQLSSCNSIFAWVQAWNSYFARFFPNNFSKPAMCFGRDHIDMAISTLSRIERAIFPSKSGTGNGATGYLRKVIADRFGIHDLPEGFFYFPVELGGLELINPYIPLMAMRENIKQTPHRRLQLAFIADEAEYRSAKERFEKHGAEGGAYATNTRRFAEDEDEDENDSDGSDASKAGSDPEEFPPLEEFRRYSETYSRPLLRAYKDLIRIPEENSIDQSPSFRGAQSSLQLNCTEKITDEWMLMSPYWKWVAELYQGEMVARYGSLAAVSREFMPLGVVKTLREGRMRWEN